MSRYMRSFVSALFLISFCATALFASAGAFDAREYLDHVKYLASDALEGRLTGTKGCEMAADYIASFYKGAGAAPGNNGSYFQQYEFTSGVTLADGNTLEWLVHGQSELLELGKDWTPEFFSHNADVQGGLVFAGYGISAASGENYDDYADMDATGKVVVVLRHEPQSGDDKHFRGKLSTAYSDLRYKAYAAQNHGAVALIVTTGPLDKDAADEDRMMKLSASDVFGEMQIPVVYAKRDKIEEVVKEFGGDLSAMQKQMDEDLLPATLDMSYITAHVKTNLNRTYTKSANVVAMLPGTEYPDQYIVIGAHYDHLGHGEAGASMLTSDELAALPWDKRIHHGADDNASGDAGTMLLAEYFAKHGGNRRTLVFINFSGEELGDLGSLNYVNHPIFPLDKTIAMVNFDMIGRVHENTITIQGIGSAAEWPQIFDDAGKGSPLTVKRFDDAVGGSDFTSFYDKGIPIVNFFSGLHDDYHRPSDTADKINSEGAVEVLDIAKNVISELDSREAPLTYQKTKGPETSTSGVDQGSGFNVYFGSIPDYSYDGKDGVKLQGVRDGSPAAEAGCKAGDLLVEFGGAVITNIYDFTYALQDHKPGDVVKVVVIRDGQRMELTATLKAR